MIRTRVLTAAAVLAVSLQCSRPDDREALVVAIAEQPSVLNPVTSEGVSETAILAQLFQRLADPPGDLDIRNESAYRAELASSWERSDSVTLVFRLDPRAHWHDGAAVTAEDVVFTHRLARDTLVGSPHRALLERILEVSAADRSTVVVRFREPYPTQMYDATFHLWIAPRHLLDSVPAERLANHPYGRSPVGSGPFALGSWGEGRIELVRVDPSDDGPTRQIWLTGRSWVSRRSALDNGEVHLVPEIWSAAQVAEAERLSGVTARRIPGHSYAFVVFNLRDSTVLHRSVRRALELAVDREALADAVWGEGTPVPPGPVAPIHWIWEHSGNPRGPDPDSALALLEASGWTDSDGDGIRERNGRPLSFELLVPPEGLYESAAAVLAPAWAAVGADVVVIRLEQSILWDRLAAGDFQAAIDGNSADPVPWPGLRQRWFRGGALNDAGFYDPRFETLVSRAEAALEPRVAVDTWREALDIFRVVKPAIFLAAPGPVLAHDERLSLEVPAVLWSDGLADARFD